MKILTSEQMQSIDRRATEQFLIPSILLMENAALAVAQAIRSRFPEADPVAIFCGSGSNGGDGFAVARHLESLGVTPLILIIAEKSMIKGDARINLEICERLRLPLYELTDDDTLEEGLARASQADLVVDAIFGTGLNRPPEGLHADAIRGMLSLRLPIVAVDIPSGLNASSAAIVDPVVRADFTVTFAQPKIAHVFQPAADYCGEILVADIGIPHAALEAEGILLSVAEASDFLPLFAARKANSHKGTYGHVGIVAGSRGRSGAAILSARGSLRMGAGLTTVITDNETAMIVDCVSVESMTLRTDIAPPAVERILADIRNFDSLLIGPGLPDEEQSYETIRAILRSAEMPAVIDATASNAFAGRLDELNPDGRSRVITPHPGEMARLLGITPAQVNADRINIVRDTAERTSCVVVLKGNQTLVATPDGQVSVNPTGNPGMATGGMGDVLGGMIAALLAGGCDPFEAARAAVFIHGSAGDLLRDKSADLGMAAMDLADMIPAAVADIRQR
ncbi:MAG: NAD(P)H-hydrate dehydratase [Acidobacteriota bacterium]